MKYLHKFNENIETTFDLDLKLSKIKDKYTEQNVVDMFNKEWPNWVDSNWDDNDDDHHYDNNFDWYEENGDNVAREVILDIIIDDDNIDTNDREELENKLSEIYPILQPL